MRHHRNNRKFGLENNARKALIKSLLRSLILKGKIKTTEAKAKEIRPMVEKLITLAKKGDLASRRLVIARMGSVQSTEKLFTKIAKDYADRAGGYTRVVKLAPRKSDGSKMAVIEFV